MASRLPLRVAVFAAHEPRGRSHSRLHSVMLAHAVAAAGGEAHLIADRTFAISRDIEGLVRPPIAFHEAVDFRAALPDGSFDWVIVNPPRRFHQEFYEACLDFASARQARLGLLNVELNDAADAACDPSLRNYLWSAGVDAGLVLSDSREAHQVARVFYRGLADAKLRFEVWPPIGRVTASTPKRGGRRPERAVDIDPAAAFADSALRLADILLRSTDAVAPLEASAWRVSLQTMRTDTPTSASARQTAAGIPAEVRSARLTARGVALVSLALHVKPGVDRVQATAGGDQAVPVAWDKAPESGRQERIEVHMAVPASLVRQPLTITAYRGTGAAAGSWKLKIEHIGRGAPERPAKVALTKDVAVGGRRLIQGLAIAPVPVDEVRMSGDRGAWLSAEVEPMSIPALSLDPRIRASCCRFKFDCPWSSAIDGKQMQVLLVSKGRAVDWLTGWPPT